MASEWASLIQLGDSAEGAGPQFEELGERGTCGWGDWTPERGDSHPPSGNYEGVGDDNPYCA